MRVFNRHVSMRGLTVFGFETVLISGSILVAAAVHGSLTHATSALWKVVLVTALCELCLYYNDLYDLTRADGIAVPPVVGSPSELPRIVRSHRIDGIVVRLSDRRGHLPLNELLQAKLTGVRVEDAATIYERITGKILVDELKPSALIFSD